MGRNTARPDDLDAFSHGTRGIDNDLRHVATRLRSAYEAFRGGCHWGALHADSLLHGLSPQFVELNGEDARWVATIADAFRRADACGALPDAAIAAVLRQAGLGDTRRSVTFDDPVAFGFPPTTGYTNDPVNTATGNFVELETDLALGGLLEGLSFERVFNSRSDLVGPFGRGWSSWATTHLRDSEGGAQYEGPDGRRAHFDRTDDGYGRVLGVPALVEPLRPGLALAWLGGERWEFDAEGRPARTWRGPGTEVRMHHDAGRLVALEHESGKRIELEWDGERIVAASCSDGRAVAYGYDRAGNLVSAGERRYDVDDTGRVVAVMDADGVVEAENTYDDEGRVVSQLSPFGRRTAFAYLPGRVTVTSDAEDATPNTFVHDDYGRALEIVDGDEQAMAFEYDRAGNPVKIVERGGAVTVQEFDERARLVRRVLPTGAELTFDHDDEDRVVEVAVSTGAVTRLRYDADERTPAEIVDPEGGVSRLTVEGGLVRAIVDPDGVAVTFEFDADGGVVAATDADGNVTRLERDAAGRVVASTSPSGRRQTFDYDDHGRLATRRDAAGGVWRYEHSPAGRPTSRTDPTGARREIRYAPHGKAAAIVDPLGRATELSHDAYGNLARLVAPDGATWRLGYDALSRPSTMVDPDRKSVV